MINLTSSSVLFVCSVGLLYLMFRTNSLRGSIPTTAFIATMAITSLLHMFEFYLASLIFLVVVMCKLVWRVIPVESHDTWKKA